MTKKDRSKKETAFDYLLKSGFIGSFEGSPNLSTDYKKILSDSLAKKHGVKKRRMLKS